MRFLLMGAPFEPYHEGETPEEQAREEALAQWGTIEDVLAVDIDGLVMLNTTGIEIEFRAT